MTEILCGNAKFAQSMTRLGLRNRSVRSEIGNVYPTCAEHAHHGGQVSAFGRWIAVLVPIFCHALQISISFESLKDTARRQGAAAKSFELDVVMHGTGSTNRD